MKRITMIATIAWLSATSYGWSQTPSSSNDTFVDRPATASALGDTGIWYVPTGETLPAGKWSVNLSKTETKFDEGLTHVGNIPVSAAFGLGHWVEVFGSVRTFSRVDRNTQDLFAASSNAPVGVIDFPARFQGWNGSELGDTFIGTKVSLMSQQRRRQPMALAVRATLKVPTADEAKGVGTGKADFSLDGIASKEFNKRVELAGYTGYASRGDPSGIHLADGVTWGIGGDFPSRSRIRGMVEFYGEHLLGNQLVVVPGLIVAADGTTSLALSRTQNPLNLSIGVTLQNARGVLFSTALVSQWNTRSSSNLVDQIENASNNKVVLQFRVGFHSGVLTHVANAPAIAVIPPPPAPAPEARRNGSPSVRAQCDPCDIEAGKAIAIRAAGSDPDGDPVTFRWTTPEGSIADASSAATTWNAPMQPGPVTLTVTVDDGKGGTAADSITVDVREAPVATSGAREFQDVQFAFDKSSLDADARALLDAAAATLKMDPTIQLEIEGHTCNIGTAAYNLALGARRATAVRDYLISRGIAPQRMTTISYGEARPKFDNDTDAGRSKNRRAVLTVRVQ